MYVCVFVCGASLTCWMSVSTILYRSGMCVTMSFMLSSDVLTRVGPNTRARLRGSICTHIPNQDSVNPNSVIVTDDCDKWLHFKNAISFHSPCFYLSYLLQSSSDKPRTSKCGNNNLEGLESVGEREREREMTTLLNLLYLSHLTKTHTHTYLRHMFKSCSDSLIIKQMHTSFFIVFNLSDALSIRLASMKSLYLSIKVFEY